MEELAIGAIVKVRRKKDLLCMYKYPDISGQSWMKNCGTEARIMSSSKQNIGSSDIKIYGWEDCSWRTMYTLDNVFGIQFFAEDLELIED